MQPPRVQQTAIRRQAVLTPKNHELPVQFRFSVLTILAAALCGCSSAAMVSDSPRTDNFGALNGATIEVLAEGGFAALAVRHVVTHDDRKYLYTNRHLCAQPCGAPLDSASGTLNAAAADSLFNIVLAHGPFALKDDYGTTRNGADMFSYTVQISAEGKSKTVRFDDGTMPEEMRAILDAVEGTVAAARR